VSFSAGSRDDRTRHDTIVTGNRIGIAGRRIGEDSYVVLDYTSDPIVKQVTGHIQDWQNARGILRENGVEVLDQPMHTAGVSGSDTSSFVVLGGHIMPEDGSQDFEGKFFGLIIVAMRIDTDLANVERELGKWAGITL
jgi:catabolite regulation protein CreA